MSKVQPARRVLYHIVCGSSSAPLAQHLVVQAQEAGWDVCVITTPHGTKFIETVECGVYNILYHLGTPSISARYRASY